MSILKSIANRLFLSLMIILGGAFLAVSVMVEKAKQFMLLAVAPLSLFHLGIMSMATTVLVFHVLAAVLGFFGFIALGVWISALATYFIEGDVKGFLEYLKEVREEYSKDD